MGISTVKRQAWVEHIAAWVASGQTQRAYCDAQELRYFAFDYWRRFVLKQNALLTPPQSSTPPAVFIPLVAARPVSSPDCSSVIEVRLIGGARLLWPDGRALTELAQLLHLLAA
jgi:hypothetical protein